MEPVEPATPAARANLRVPAGLTVQKQSSPAGPDPGSHTQLVLTLANYTEFSSQWEY